MKKDKLIGGDLRKIDPRGVIHMPKKARDGFEEFFKNITQYANDMKKKIKKDNIDFNKSIILINYDNAIQKNKKNTNDGMGR